MSGWRRAAADGSTVVSGSTGMPVGAPIPWLVSTIPSGYIEFAGQAITQTQYPQLYAIFGATLPDLRGRMFLGASATYPIGSTGGEAAHTLTIAELPSHDHDVPIGVLGGGGVDNTVTQASQWLASRLRSGLTGGGAAHNTLPPYRAVRWITVAA